MSLPNLVLIQDEHGKWLRFENARRLISCRTHGEVSGLLVEIDRSVRDGLYAAGYFSYESAPGIDPHLKTRSPAHMPLAWFGIYDRVEKSDSIPAGQGGSFTTGPWEPDIRESEYLSALTRIKEYLVAGATYQVNFTFRLAADFKGDPYSFFVQMCRAQQSRNCAYIRTGNLAICSASPELFFDLDDRRIIAMPMKGTASRGLLLEEDNARAEALQNSEKDRAENIMIVDMVRNDLGRIAEPDSVKVVSSCDVEKYPTVFQMTSTIEARTRAGLRDIIKAVFPCASVTGAPKVQTMKIISELETTPRGVYCGAIGYAGPGRKARFNVAIRTAVVDMKRGRVEYGVGSGVVADSIGKSEYAECLEKAAVLTRPFPEFELLETILWTKDDGYFLLDEHLNRVSASARYFGFTLDMKLLLTALHKRANDFSGRMKVRVLADKAGKFRLESAAIKEESRPWKVGFARTPVSSSDVFLYHKTTNRAVYEGARKERAGLDDVILVNEKGEVTETTLANIVAVINGRSITPPVRCGLLGGTCRQHYLKKGLIEEGILTKADVLNASEIYLLNSVRGKIPAAIVHSR